MSCHGPYEKGQKSVVGTSLFVHMILLNADSSDSMDVLGLPDSSG
jgi:hypothetical protein